MAGVFTDFRAGALVVVSDLARLALRGAASSMCFPDAVSVTAPVSKAAEATLALGLSVDTGWPSPSTLGWIVRPCCSIPEATAAVRLVSGFNKASQRYRGFVRGSASFLKMNLHSINYGVISRQPSASTATGYHKVHVQEQGEIIETAFSI